MPHTPKNPRRLIRSRRPPLTIAQILVWADNHHARTGRWPVSQSGPILDDLNEKWSTINSALIQGVRGLRGGSSLARLLDSERGVRNQKNLPRLTEAQIVAWAKAHFRFTGKWPTEDAGPIAETRGEVWLNVSAALAGGTRGLPGGDSLAQLLSRELGVRNGARLPPLSEAQILEWADAHYRQTGQWPRATSISGSLVPGETWIGIDDALRVGLRGLRGDSSLFRLLNEQRQVRSPKFPPRLTIGEVLAWGKAFFDRTGRWPGHGAGPIPEAEGETWSAVGQALKRGARGLPRGESLAHLWAHHFGARDLTQIPSLTIQEILRWADAHFEATGKWPHAKSGPIAPAPGETWLAIDMALRVGIRSLPGGSSLAKLLARQRNARNKTNLPRLTVRLILGWADTHYRRTGRWPGQMSGAIPGSGGETWAGVTTSLARGCRGLPGGDTLCQLLQRNGR
jgi:hypothetical protein